MSWLGCFAMSSLFHLSHIFAGCLFRWFAKSVISRCFRWFSVFVSDILVAAGSLAKWFCNLPVHVFSPTWCLSELLGIKFCQRTAVVSWHCNLSWPFVSCWRFETCRFFRWPDAETHARLLALEASGLSQNESLELCIFSHDVFGHFFLPWANLDIKKGKYIYSFFCWAIFGLYSTPFSSGGKILSIKGRTNFFCTEKT